MMALIFATPNYRTIGTLPGTWYMKSPAYRIRKCALIQCSKLLKYERDSNLDTDSL